MAKDSSNSKGLSSGSSAAPIRKAEVADFPAFEAEILKRWDKEKTFDASLKQREGSKRFSFYDGPPFASGEPHYGHVEQTTVKDAIVRYKTMRGYYAPRRTGWDTHGLPIEYHIEKELGLNSKQDIINYGIQKFNDACRSIVFRYQEEFDSMYRRMGRWGDPRETYATLNVDYIESVWWVFSQLYQKDLIYQGYKSVAYCPRCSTPLSNFEVNDGYKDDVEDPSLFVKFELKGDSRRLLAWTTTPWSLPANAALAVNPKEAYATVQLDSGEEMVLAEKRLEVLGEGYKVIKTEKGTELVGKTYMPLFKLPEGRTKDYPTLYRVWGADFVSVDDGSGILHVAPAYGEDDLSLGQAHGLPILHSVDQNGKMTNSIGMAEIEGMFFKKADEHIIKYLSVQGSVFSAETFKHTYPFCWRCDTPLLYYAINTWFVDVTSLKPQLLKTAELTNWVPAHTKPGRFVNWLDGARDWAISRNRFWGAPIPIWQCSKNHNTVITSLQQLRELAEQPELVGDLHRPGIDEVTILCPECGQTAKRVNEVFDCWFESGAMPYAQDHYPFEHSDQFKSAFPADFVVEAFEQVQKWFYTLHVLSTALFGQPAFKNAIADGLILAPDGKKLSKRLRNYPPINELLDRFGADTTRLFVLSSPLMAGENTRMSDDAFRDIQRQVFMTMWNVYSFFSTYVEIDKWSPGYDGEPKSDNLLDQWMIARVNEVLAEMTKQADAYEISRAVRPLRELIDDLSNWYVRRSRRRFWKSEDDNDKLQAYATLHYTLVLIAQMLAPWAPFISDKLYRELMGGESVHLTDWPTAGPVNNELLQQMLVVRQAVTEGLSQRAEAGIKVRQPLTEATLIGYAKLPDQLTKLVAEELNVKQVLQKEGKKQLISLNSKITSELKLEGVARDIVRLIQSQRKAEDLQVDDRILLTLGTDSVELKKAIEVHADIIKHETLATKLTITAKQRELVPHRIAGEDMTVAIKRA